MIHEVRHAYQRRAIEALANVPEEYYSLSMFDDACLFWNGKENYKKGSFLEGYYYNELEIDARSYAEASVKAFFDKLDMYLNQECKGNVKNNLS